MIDLGYQYNWIQETAQYKIMWVYKLYFVPACCVRPKLGYTCPDMVWWIIGGAQLCGSLIGGVNK